jgi:hypothetical protein
VRCAGEDGVTRLRETARTLGRRDLILDRAGARVSETAGFRRVRERAGPDRVPAAAAPKRASADGRPETPARADCGSAVARRQRRCAAQMLGQSRRPLLSGPRRDGGPGRPWFEGVPAAVASATYWSGSPPRTPGRLRGCSPPCRGTGGALTLAALARLVAIHRADSAHGLGPGASTPRRRLRGPSARWQHGRLALSSTRPQSWVGMVVAAGFESVAVATGDAMRPRRPARNSASSPDYRRLRRALSRMTAVSTRVAKNWFAATPGDTFQV